MLLSFFLALVFASANAAPDEFAYVPPPNFTASYQLIALHHPVSTSSALAQLYFDQGLTLTYAFNHDAAYWSFLKASQADPNLAMAYWGMALVLGKNINTSNQIDRERKAFDWIQKGQRLLEKATESERDYIAALGQRYTDASQPDYAQLSQAYSQAM